MEEKIKVLQKIYEKIVGIKTIIEDESDNIVEDDYGNFLTELYNSFDKNGTLLEMDDLFESFGH